MTHAVDQGPEDVPHPRGGMPLPPREAAAWVATRLSRAGYRALFAGGCVRDRLLGLEPVDYDVATNATPEHIRAVFPHAIGVGESFGVMLVRHGGRSVEVATFRADSDYTDRRRPDSVRFTDDREDALRRDFTINGLFEDPLTGEIIDHVDGRADLAARRLRAIGDPRARFGEDRLRVLRAVRFAARFDLEIDPGTQEAVREFAHDLGGVSRERIGHEVRRMLAHASRARAVALCEELALAPAVLQEPPSPVDCALLHALPAGAAVPTALAAWMLGRGSGAADSARVEHWRQALLLSNNESESLGSTLLLRSRIQSAWAAGDTAARKRMAASAVFGAALQLLAAARSALAADVAKEAARLASTGLAPEPFVTGDDLLRAGLAAGPRFRGILDALYDRQLNGELTNRQEALSAVAELASGRSAPPTAPGGA